MTDPCLNSCRTSGCQPPLLPLQVSPWAAAVHTCRVLHGKHSFWRKTGHSLGSMVALLCMLHPHKARPQAASTNLCRSLPRRRGGPAVHAAPAAQQQPPARCRRPALYLLWHTCSRGRSPGSRSGRGRVAGPHSFLYSGRWESWLSPILHTSLHKTHAGDCVARHVLSYTVAAVCCCVAVDTLAC